MFAPFEKYILADDNPLGIDEEHFIDKDAYSGERDRSFRGS
jgi:hypothetical protein